MATLIKLGSMVSADNPWRDIVVLRKLSSSKASLWVSMPARKPEPTGVIMSFIREGVVGCQVQHHLQEMPDRSAASCSESDGLRRERPLFLAGRQLLLERTEESSAGRRREFLVSSLFFSFISGSTWTSTEAAAVAAEDATTEVPLELYSNAKDGFTFMRPTPWNKVDKPGASIFFEDPESRSNNIGVTVAPVRIASLDGFGTVDDIVKKLVKAEKDKPSTKEIQVIGVLERKLRDNTPLYSLEYTLDTTRGSKRVLTSVTVAGYKLYILNIIFADGPVAPASQGLNDALHQVLNSFELLA